MGRTSVTRLRTSCRCECISMQSRVIVAHMFSARNQRQMSRPQGMALMLHQ